MAKKKLSSKSNYVPNRMINEIEVERNGKTTYIDGAKVLDGMYVKKGVKFGNGGGTAVSSENGGYAVGTNADFNSNQYQPDVDLQLMKRGGTLTWNGESFSAILKDAKENAEESKKEIKKIKGTTYNEDDLHSVAMGVKDDINDIYDLYDEDDSEWVDDDALQICYSIAEKMLASAGKKQKFAKGGGLKSKAKYVPNRMVQSVEVERKGKTTDIDGADILDGFYVKKGVKYAKGSTVKGGKFKLGDKVKVVRGVNKGEKGVVSNTDSDFFGEYTINVRGHKLGGFKADDLVKYAKGSTVEGGEWSHIKTNGEYRLVKGTYPYKKQVRIGYLKNVNFNDITKLVAELNGNTSEYFAVSFYLTNLGMSNDKNSFGSVFLGYETENDEDNRFNVFNIEEPIAEYIGSMKKFIKEWHIEENEGGNLGEFEVYDEETGKTLIILAHSNEEAEGISETIDFNDYEDGDLIDGDFVEVKLKGNKGFNYTIGGL